MMQEHIENFEMLIQNDDATARTLHDNHIKRLEAKLEALKKKELSQWEKYSEEQMPKEIFDQLNEKLLQEKDEIQQALCYAYESVPEHVDIQEQLTRFKTALEMLDDPDVSAEKKNKHLKDCIEKIVYNRERMERVPSQQTRYYDKELKQTRYTSPLETGSNWTKPPIQLDITFKMKENPNKIKETQNP